MKNFESVLRNKKPVIAMVHLGALIGTPLYKEDNGLKGIVKNANKDLTALKNAGVDAVMFSNKNHRPYEFTVDAASTAGIAYVIGKRHCINRHGLSYGQ